MHRSGPAKGEQGEAVRVLATFQRMDARGVSHTFVGDLMDAPGGFLKRKPQRVSDTFLDSLLGSNKVQLELTTEKIVRIKITKHQIRVSYCRLRTAQSVANGPRFSSSRFWSDLQQPQRIDARNRASARANLDHLDHRHLDGQTRSFFEAITAINLKFVRDKRLALVNDAELSRRSAHIEREQIAMAAGRPIMSSSQSTRSRTGFDQANGKANSGISSDDAAAGNHQENFVFETETSQPGLQFVEIAFNQVLHIDVGNGG